MKNADPSTSSVSPLEPDNSTTMHVFHYPTHSIAWTLIMHETPGCSGTTPHYHTRDGHDLFVFCDVTLSRASMERHVEDMIADHQSWDCVCGPVRVLRHRDDV